MINFKKVSKSFSQGTNIVSVLENLTFELSDTGIIAIVGKSGSGKSTFLSLLAGLDRPTSGEISIDQTQISQLSENDLTNFRANNIGIIFQSFNLIDNFTAIENILLPLEIRNEIDSIKKAEEILEQVGLSHRKNHFPSELSGGEKQRVAIARALVTKPKYVLADEPSGNLDPETGESVMNILLTTARELKQTLLLVTHDFELAKKCDHIYELKNHQIEKL